MSAFRVSEAVRRSAVFSSRRGFSTPSYPPLNAPYFDVLTPVRFLERSASVFPEHEAVAYDEDMRFTYKQFMTRVNQFANALKKAGVGRGDKVAVLCPNTPPCLEAHYAIPAVGAAIVPINTRIPAHEVSYIMNHSDAKVALVDTELAHGVIPADLKSVKTFVNIHDEAHFKGDATPLPGPEYEEFLASGGDGQKTILDVEDEYSMISLNYTSGTTGNPKGVMIHHRGAYVASLGNIMHMGLNGRHSYLWTLPMFHCNGWCYTWAVTAVGAKHVCLRKVDYPHIFHLLHYESITHMCAAPVVVTGCSAHALKHHEQQHYLKDITVMTAGAPPAPKVIEDLEDFGAKIVHGYGLTEVYGPNCLCEWHEEWDGLSPAGRAQKKARQGVPYITTHNADVWDLNTNTPVARDGKTVGEIVLRGNSTMLGYYKNEKATTESFEGGWFHTGDLAVMHPDNYMEIVDRKKDIIISGGENISSVQVEKAIFAHPAVAQVGVVAVPDEKWGEVPKAFIALKPGATLTVDEIKNHCKKHLSGFSVPKAFEFRKELPHNANGKLQKNLLRNAEWKGRAHKVH